MVVLDCIKYMVCTVDESLAIHPLGFMIYFSCVQELDDVLTLPSLEPCP